MVSFIEAKIPDLEYVGNLLKKCAEKNQWANRGPLYDLLSERYAEHFGVDDKTVVLPCSNAGIALECMARTLASRAGKSLHWVGSAFSFKNLGRGYFADMEIIDCDESGNLSLTELAQIPSANYDGIIVVNPFGLNQNLSQYIEFAKLHGKKLLIDNAAGVHSRIPDWPWQAFSLHHTKPYGVGEGGLALLPKDFSNEFYELLNYGTAPRESANWLNNGKISDISCAFLIDRLNQIERWKPKYLEQAERVHSIAISVGLKPLLPFDNTVPAMSWAFLSDSAIPLAAIGAAKSVTFGKYYQPLRDLPTAQKLYTNLVNIPTHPDVAKLADDQLSSEISRLIL